MRRVVAAQHVHLDDGTSALAEKYFVPLEIVSTLDAPIYRDGRVCGLVCHEHRGAPRRWTDDEADFSISVAEIVAMQLVSADLRAAEDALRTQELALVEAMKEEALARMARGVAHDVNNILAIVLAQSDLTASKAENPDVVRAGHAVISESVLAAARILQALLEFGKPELAGNSDLDEVLGAMSGVLRAAVGESRAFSIELDGGRAVVPLSRERLEQIVLNLVTNARDATLGDGRILLSTERASPDTARIRVTDDGEGIDDRMRDQIFEPYFSTRARGSGLGLATVMRLVRHVRGTVSVESEAGRGACFTITLPIRDR